MKKLIIFAITAVTVLVFVSFPFFAKVQIKCQSQYGTCPEEISSKLNSLNGKSLFSAKKGSSNILKSAFIVSEYSMQYKIPNTLQMDVLIKKPIFAIKSSVSNTFGLIDQYGTVLALSENSTLPNIVATSDLPKVGTRVDDKILFALNLAGGVFQMYQVKDGIMSENTLLVELPGQIKVIFPLEGDYKVLLGSLRLIYSKLQIDSNAVKYTQIDLRFKNPVVR